MSLGSFAQPPPKLRNRCIFSPQPLACSSSRPLPCLYNFQEILIKFPSIMDSSPLMLQVYRDDEHASVAAPLLPINRDAETVQPRWSKQSNKNKNAVRGAIATGAFLATYLFFCAWVAFANNGVRLIVHLVLVINRINAY
jgi:hypothetical protein